jgi:hypothetical protein
MAKAKSKPNPLFEGDWQIISMPEWDEDIIHSEVQAFIEFDSTEGGRFRFGCFRGDMDCRRTTRKGKQAVEWTWNGYEEDYEENHPESGTGWAVLKGDELHGLIAFDDDDEYEFVARRQPQARSPSGLSPRRAPGAEFPAISRWVQENGVRLEVARGEEAGFVVRALDDSGVVLEKSGNTLAEALAALEQGIRQWYEEQGIEVQE